jgi:hypothetical protein
MRNPDFSKLQIRITLSVNWKIFKELPGQCWCNWTLVTAKGRLFQGMWFRAECFCLLLICPPRQILQWFSLISPHSGFRTVLVRLSAMGEWGIGRETTPPRSVRANEWPFFWFEGRGLDSEILLVGFSVRGCEMGSKVELIYASAI